MSSKDTKETNVLAQASILMVAGIVTRIIGVLYRSPVTSIIGDEGNGYYTSAYNIYTIILLLSSYSIPSAVSKIIASKLALKEYRNAHRIFRCALIYVCVIGGAASLFTLFGAELFLEGEAAVVLRVFSPTIFLSGFVGVLRGYFQGHNTMVPTSISQIIEQILNAIFSILMAYVLILPYLPSKTITYEIARHGAAGSAIGTGVGVLTGLIFCFIIYRAYQPKVKIQMKHDRTKYIESYGNILKILLLTITPVIFSTAIYNCSATIDQTIFSNILVGKGITAKVVSEFYGLFSGQYNVLINVPVAMASALSNAIVPNVSAAYALGKKDDMNDSIQMAIRFTMMIAIPCAVGLGVLNSSINGLIFGATYAKGLGAAMLRIGAVSVIFYCLSTLTNGILQGMGKMRVPVRHSAISVVVNIVVLWLLLTYTDCKTYGLVFATMAFSLVMCLLNAHSIKKYTGFHQEITKTFIKPALSAAVMGVVCFLIQYAVQSVLPFGRVCFAICVIIAVPVGALIYFAAIIKLRVFTEEELTKIPKGNLIVRLAKKLHLL